MRGTRWLILIAILVIASGVGVVFRLQKQALEKEAPPRPASLPDDLSSNLNDWYWSKLDGKTNRVVVDIRAKHFGRTADSSRVTLGGVRLRIYKKTGTTYDLVETPRAEFAQSDKRLYSDSEVEITLDVPVEGKPAHQLVSIRTSGVNFDSDTGKAVTSRPAHFVFEHGDGESVGASYDPTSRELHLDSQVLVHWNTKGPHTQPMTIRAGELLYREAASEVWLLNWARLTRNNTVLESGPATVKLADGVIQAVDAATARGTDRYPNRQIQYAADHLWVEFDDNGQTRRVAGEPNAMLISDSASGRTTINARHVDLDFTPGQPDSVLSRALATGDGVLVSKPLPAAGNTRKDPPQTRILRSEKILLTMRPGGRDIDTMETQAPGQLEFLPAAPGEHHRTLDGDHLWIRYAERNQIESFRATAARTRTDPTARDKARGAAPTFTSSRNLLATFDPKTNQLSRMEQWGDFTYDQGERKARAARATMAGGGDQMLLENQARVWDTSGATSGDRIRIDQKSGDFTAEGHVNSSHAPDRKPSPGSGSGMLSGDQPLQAVAKKMVSTNRNRLVHYEDGVVLWQGPDRIQAQAVDIDREKRSLRATGGVITQFLDRPTGEAGGAPAGDAAAKSDASWEAVDTAPKAGAPAKPATPQAAPVFTIVRASELVYTDSDRLAHYTGNAVLLRPGLEVRAREIRAWLADSGSDSRLERAFADGSVRIVQSTPARTRIGTGDHSEYYTADQKIVMRASAGGAELNDSLRGNTRGTELTYFADEDRLLVNGSLNRPAASRIRRK